MQSAGVPEIEADLEIEDPWGRPITVRVRGGQATIALPRAALGLRSLKLLPPRAERQAKLRELQRALVLAAPRVRVTCGGRTVARLVPGARRGNWLGRLLRVAPFEVRLRGILAAVLLPPPRI
jgi:hypothetical protein